MASRIGRLRSRVAFKAETLTADGGGGNALAWTTETTVWGSLQPLRGTEREGGGRLEAANSAILRVRSSTQTRAITVEHVASVDGVDYQIRSIINPDQRAAYLEMMVERADAYGVAQ